MSGLKLIVGLGNPGAEHARTRHNAGFHFVEALAEKAGARWSVDAKLFGETCKVTIDGQGVWLLKPATFMNLSGKSVTAAQRFWKIAPEETLVAHDELDLPVGAARLKLTVGTVARTACVTPSACSAMASSTACAWVSAIPAARKRWSAGCSRVPPRTTRSCWTVASMRLLTCCRWPLPAITTRR